MADEKPIHSDIRDGSMESRYWCALLDGRPVGSCVAFDTREGWVEVFVLQAQSDGIKQTLRSKLTVRVSGHVEAVPIADLERLLWTMPPFEVKASPSVIALDAEDDTVEYRASIRVTREAMLCLRPEVFEQATLRFGKQVATDMLDEAARLREQMTEPD